MLRAVTTASDGCTTIGRMGRALEGRIDMWRGSRLAGAAATGLARESAPGAPGSGGAAPRGAVVRLALEEPHDGEHAAVAGAGVRQPELGEDARHVLLGAAQRDVQLVGDSLVRA